MKNKYIVTLWASYYDYDGLYNNFRILGIYSNLEEAELKLYELSNKLIAKDVKGVYNKYIESEPPDNKKREGSIGMYYSLPNTNNKVLLSVLRHLYHEDMPGYNKNYYSFEVIEVSENKKVDAELFICSIGMFTSNKSEVKSFFDKLGVDISSIYGDIQLKKD